MKNAELIFKGSVGDAVAFVQRFEVDYSLSLSDDITPGSFLALPIEDNTITHYLSDLGSRPDGRTVLEVTAKFSMTDDEKNANGIPLTATSARVFKPIGTIEVIRLNDELARIQFRMSPYGMALWQGLEIALREYGLLASRSLDTSLGQTDLAGEDRNKRLVSQAGVSLEGQEVVVGGNIIGGNNITQNVTNVFYQLPTQPHLELLEKLKQTVGILTEQLESYDFKISHRERVVPHYEEAKTLSGKLREYPEVTQAVRDYLNSADWILHHNGRIGFSSRERGDQAVGELRQHYQAVLDACNLILEKQS